MMWKNIPFLSDYVSKRESSWDRSGDNRDFIYIPENTSRTLADIKGAGYIAHIFLSGMSVNRHWLRQVLIKMYWDNEENPSVEVPVGDFFGAFHCRPRHFSSIFLSVTPWYFPGMNCYFPMPFANHAKIEIDNQSKFPVILYYHIDYELCNSIEGNLGRFHAQWRRENPTKAVPPLGMEYRYGGAKNLTGEENYTILEAEGDGHVIGIMLGVDNLEGGWWGEGDDMIFIDGEIWPPSIHGTGTEELFGLAYCPTYEYTTLYCGFQLISKEDWSGKNAAYRFFLFDPIRFKKSIKITIEHGHANNLSNDYSSVAFWYQTEPHSHFPTMPSPEERLPREPEYYWKKIVPLEREMWQIFFEQGERGIRWQKYSLKDQWQVRKLIYEINEAYTHDEYKKMKLLCGKVIKLMKKYG